MRFSSMLVLLPVLLLAGVSRAAEEAKPPKSAERMIFGAVHRGSVYTAETTQAFAKGDFVDGGVTASSIEWNEAMPWIDFPARWKMKDGNLTMLFDEYPQSAPIGLRQRNFSQLTGDLGKLSEYRQAKKVENGKYELVYNFPVFGYLGGRHETLIGTIYESMRNFVNDKYPYKAIDEKLPFSHYEFFFDLIIDKEGACDFFILASEPLQLGINGTNKGPGKWPPPWWAAQDPLKPMLGFRRLDDHKRWALVDQFKDPPFNERFHSFTKGTTYFFLTDSGKVYISKKPDKGERKLESLWDNAKYPITAALEDADTGKVFLFGKAHKGDMLGKDFYWELDETVRRVDYDPSAVKPVKTEEPLKTVMEYARFLADEKKIKLEKK